VKEEITYEMVHDMRRKFNEIQMDGPIRISIAPKMAKKLHEEEGLVWNPETTRIGYGGAILIVEDK